MTRSTADELHKGASVGVTDEPPSGCPTAEEVASAYVSLRGGTLSGDDGEKEPGVRRGVVPMQSIALEGISIVSRLMQSLDNAVSGSTAAPILEYPKDIPIFTFSHESRLLTECYPFPLPDGTTAEMLPCARGRECLGMSEHLEGHETGGGIVLRALLTPEEITRFEFTGENPPSPRLCILCARLFMSEAYFETHDSQFDGLKKGVCFNFYGNLRGCHEGYKREYMIPLGSQSSWDGLIAPVACNALNKMRLVKRTGIWTVDQRELAHADSKTKRSDDVQRFR